MFRIIVLLMFFAFIMAYSQKGSFSDDISNPGKDSIYIQEVEDREGPPKVLHAEPLYIDLIRDLGARKGEKEWNFGMGLFDNQKYDEYELLVEYEFAPIDRIGFEIEVPITFYGSQIELPSDSLPSDRIESLKLATQWSFLVSEEYATSLALGYIHEFEFSDLNNFGNPLFKGNVFNPFFIAAKRWGNNYHTLLYTGPVIEQDFKTNEFHTSFQINSNFHYMISGTRNFIGLEVNKLFIDDRFKMTFRPQMRLGITDNFLIGIVAGIPRNRDNQRLSSFLRIIWEPGH